MTLQEADVLLRKLLRATLEQEALVAVRDKEIQVIQDRYAPRLLKSDTAIADLAGNLEQFYADNPPEGDRKSYQLAHGLIGAREAANPALMPLSEKWTWPKIEARLKRLWKLRYFHKPKPPGIDKMKVKRELSAEQLAKCGLKLDDGESFYYELNRLENSSEEAA